MPDRLSNFSNMFSARVKKFLGANQWQAAVGDGCLSLGKCNWPFKIHNENLYTGRYNQLLSTLEALLQRCRASHLMPPCCNVIARDIDTDDLLEHFKSHFPQPIRIWRFNFISILLSQLYLVKIPISELLPNRPQQAAYGIFVGS